jgi:NADH dehydrogenase FAD-containing subunit
LEKALTERGIEVIRGHVTHINREEKIVHVDDVSVHYDLLLIDAQRAPDTGNLPGLYDALTLEEARRYLELRQHVVSQLLRARAFDHAEHKTFVVAGAGVSGIEVATELRTLLDHACEQHCLFPDELDVVLVEHGMQPLPKGATKKLHRRLEQRDIEYYKDRVQSFTEEGVVLADRTIESRTLVWAGAYKGNAIAHEMKLQLDERGEPVLNEYLQTNDPAIFWVSERSAVPRASLVDASLQLALTQNLIAAFEGKKLRRYAAPRRPYVVTTGEGHGILVWGNWSWQGRLPYRLRRWLARQPAVRLENR